VFLGLMGTGNIVFDACSDGSTLIHLAGNLAKKIIIPRALNQMDTEFGGRCTKPGHGE